MFWEQQNVFYKIIALWSVIGNDNWFIKTILQMSKQCTFNRLVIFYFFDLSISSLFTNIFVRVRLFCTHNISRLTRTQ